MVLHTARSEGGLLQLDFSSKLSFLAGLLAQLDTLQSMSAGLRVQESVMAALHNLWHAVCVSKVAPCPMFVACELGGPSRCKYFFMFLESCISIVVYLGAL